MSDRPFDRDAIDSKPNSDGADTTFRHQVRQVLLNLHDLAYLQSHPLAPLAQLESDAAFSDRGKALRRAMKGAIDVLRVPDDPNSPNRRHRSYHILAWRYLQGFSNRDVQEKLGISRPEFYRSERRALDAVSSVLKDRWAPAGALGSTPNGGRAQKLPRSADPTKAAMWPQPITSFVGRERELGEVRRLLTGRSRSRLLTLTGAGGCGKTRLATEVAAPLRKAYPDGVWLIDLSGLNDPRFVARAVAAAIGIREGPTDPIETTVLDILETMRALLVLDGCEHVMDASAEFVGRVLTSCPSVQVMATSREALRIAGEVVIQVPPLAVPPRRPAETGEQVREYEAVRLFVERAQAVQSTFALTEANAATIAEICRQLDGLPLAIELAATRVRVLALEEIAERLEDRFRLLNQGSRTAPTRSQTMRASLDWSHDLLGPRERILFQRLAVFSGGWTLEAAEAVGADDSDVLDILTQLIDKSLVIAEDRGGSRRYGMLDTVRRYALELSREGGEYDAVRRRHLDWFIGVAGTGAGEFVGPNDVPWLDVLDAEKENLNAALSWSLEADPSAGLRLAGRLGWFWFRRGYRTEGCRWLELFLDAGRLGGADQAPEILGLRAAATFRLAMLLRTDGTTEGFRFLHWMALLDPPPDSDSGGDRKGRLAPSPLPPSFAERVRRPLLECLDLSRRVGDRFVMGAAFRVLGFLELTNGDLHRARFFLEQSLSLAREDGDRHLIAWGLLRLASVDQLEGNLPEMQRRVTESLGLFQELDDLLGIAWAEGSLGDLAANQGRLVEAEAYLGGALLRFQQINANFQVVATMTCLGILARGMGEVKRSHRFFDESLRLSRDIGYDEHVGWVLANQGSLARRDGDVARSHSLFVESLRHFQRTENRPGAALALCLLSLLLIATGQQSRGTRLLGASIAIYPSVALLLDREERGVYQEWAARAQVAAGVNFWPTDRSDDSGPVPDGIMADALG